MRRPLPSRSPIASTPTKMTLDVFLAIPHFRERGLNVSLPQTKADTRYLSEIAMLRDENSGLGERPVQVARKNFRILVEGESQEHSSVLRVARIATHRRGSLPARSEVCSAAAGYHGQRLSGVDPAAAGGDSGRQEQPACRDAPPEESQPGGFRHLRYRQLLAALHHQFALPAAAAFVRNAARASGRDCMRPCCRWRAA